MAFAYIICQLDYNLVVQVLALDTLTTATLIYYLANMPMIDRTNNFVQVFNEACILLSIWLMFLFTDYVPDPQLRLDFGEKLKWFLIANVAINVILLFGGLIAQVISSCKNSYRRKQA